MSVLETFCIVALLYGQLVAVKKYRRTPLTVTPDIVTPWLL